MEKSHKKEIYDFIKYWNNLFPFDRWFRKKYKIPIFSEKHLQTNILDIFFDFVDYIEANFPLKEERNTKSNYIPGEGISFKVHELTKKELDQAFEDLDIDNL